MTKKVDIWMPLYVADYLSSTNRLTTEQHGAYLLLLMDYWKNGAPPDDDAVLASITRMTLDAWSIARAKLIGFFTIENGYWIQSRIEEELKKAKENRDFAAERAKKGAEARWENARRNASSMLQGCTSPSPTPSDNNSPPNIAPDWRPSPELAKQVADNVGCEPIDVSICAPAFAAHFSGRNIDLFKELQKWVARDFRYDKKTGIK